MLQANQEPLAPDGNCNVGSKKKPFEIFANIFRRKSKDQPDCNGTEHSFEAEESNGNADQQIPRKSSKSKDIMRSSPSAAIPIPRQSTSLTDLLPKSPVSPRVKNLEDDMEALRLSRQDNPFIVQQLERLSLQDETYMVRPSELCVSPKQSGAHSLQQQVEARVMITTDYPTLLDDDESVNIHEHLIRSPPPQFPQKISHFVFPNKSPTHRSDILSSPMTPNSSSPTLSSSFGESNGGMKPRNSFSSMMSPGSCETPTYSKERKLKGLSPLLAKSGVDVLDPGMKEVLEFQKQKLFTDHSPSSSEATRRSSDTLLTSQRTPLPFGDMVIPQVKWRNSTASGTPVTIANGTGGSLPGLSGSTSVSSVASSTSNQEDEVKGQLGPIRDGKAKAVGLTPSISVQDLLNLPSPTSPSASQGVYKFGRPLQGMFAAAGSRSGSREALLQGNNSSSVDSG